MNGTIHKTVCRGEVNKEISLHEWSNNALPFQLNEIVASSCSLTTRKYGFILP